MKKYYTACLKAGVKLPFWYPKWMLKANIAQAFDPLTLSPSALFDFSNFTKSFTDTAMTTTSIQTDFIRKVQDLSGNSNHLAPSNDTRRPMSYGLPTTIGPNLITFASMTGGTGWSYASGIWTKTAGTASTLSQAISFSTKGQYVIFIDCTRTAGTLTPKFTGGTAVSGFAINKSKSHVEIFVSLTGNTTFELSADSSFAGTVTRVAVHEASAWTMNGLKFDGVDNVVVTPAINLTGTQKVTIGMSFIPDDRTASMIPWNLGDYSASVANSVDRLFNNTPNIRGRDASTSGVGISFDTDGTGFRPALRTEIIEVDFSQSTTATQFNALYSGVPVTETPVSGPLTISGLPNGSFSIGASVNGNGDARMYVHRAILIPRLLTSDEKTKLDTWLSNGVHRCAALGDSTVTPGRITGGLLADTRPVTGFIWDAEFGFADVSKIGDKIANQKTAWQAISDKSKLSAVFIQIGLNDVKTYIGGNTKTSAQVIADLQDLVNTVRTDAPSSCKIYICGLTPCKGWLNAATNPTAANAGWQAVNDAIAGNGATPITGVDGRVTSHVTALNDGSGNLATEFNTAGDHVHPNNWGRWKIAQAWRATLLGE